VLSTSARFPNTFVWRSPSLRQIFHDHGLQCEPALRWLHASFERLKHRVRDFSKNVELQLLKCGISNPHRG
jgi:hypothetical protein